jgi:hypothetical protein
VDEAKMIAVVALSPRPQVMMTMLCVLEAAAAATTTTTTTVFVGR